MVLSWKERNESEKGKVVLLSNGIYTSMSFYLLSFLERPKNSNNRSLLIVLEDVFLMTKEVGV